MTTDLSFTQTTAPLHQLPAGHPAWLVIDQCLEISSGTLSYLIDSTNYREINAVRANWVDFLALHAHETAALEGWVDAWWLFWETAHE